MRRHVITVGVGLGVLCCVCGVLLAQGGANEWPEPKEAPSEQEEVSIAPRVVARSAWNEAKLKRRYPWLGFNKSLPKLKALRDHITPPSGYTREAVTPNSFGEYLRFVPVRQDRTQTLLYNGKPVYMPSAGVVPLDLGRRDLHQCADSVLRLHAEYLWSSNQAKRAQYHYTSGDLAAWRNWRRGRVLKVRGRKVVTTKVTPVPNTHKAYRRYLDRVFTYASTRSMHRDATVHKDLSTIQAGDFFLTPGSPGHVVMVMDIAVNASGKRVALIGQGYIPAREFHIVKGNAHATIDGLWYVLPTKQGQVLDTPTWTPFKTTELKRFKIL